MFLLRIFTFFISTITAFFMLTGLFTGNFGLFIIAGIALILELLIFDARRIYIKDKILDDMYKNSKNNKY